MRTALLITLLSLLPPAQQLAAKEPILVFAAASLTDALTDIGKEFESEIEIPVRFNFEASSLLARQIAAGAPADLFFSADEAKMNWLIDQQEVEREEVEMVLSNALVVITPTGRDRPVRRLSDLNRPAVQRIALGEPQTVPAGVYARKLLETEDLWEAVQEKVVPLGNVRATLAAVESGNADAGIVYATDAAIGSKVQISVRIPREEGPDIRYPVAVLKHAPQPSKAREFRQFLHSQTARNIFTKYGFVVLDKET